MNLVVKHTFQASAERVYDAWLTPELAGRFLFATETGTMVEVSIEARVGGRFRFVERRDGVDVLHTGTYLELDRPRRLRFTFAVPLYSEVETEVDLEIVPTPAGGCELTLTHSGVLPEWRESTQKGWGMILSNQDLLVGDLP